MIFKENQLYTQKFEVTEKVYASFIDLFKDNNPLHTDEKFAQEHHFKGKVMHGNILNGFISYFIGECLPVKNVIIHSQEIHYKNPVYLGNELFFEAKVTDVFESVNAVEFNFSFRNAESIVVSKGKFQIGLLV